MLLLWILVIVLIGVSLIPTAIRYAVRKEAHYFNFKISNFNHIMDLMGIFDFDIEPMFQTIAFALPSIRLSFRNRKLLLKIQLLKIYLDFKTNNLSQVDGFRNTKVNKSKILKNTEIILQQILQECGAVEQLVAAKQAKRANQLKRSKSGIINFIIMVLFQFVSLEVEKATLTLIDSKSTESLSVFKSATTKTSTTAQQPNKNNVTNQSNVSQNVAGGSTQNQQESPRNVNDEFRLFTSNRRIRITLSDVTAAAIINKDEKLQISVKARVGYADLKNDFTKKLDRCATIDSPSMEFHMPFGFTQDDCLNGSQIFVGTKSIVADLSPATCAAYKYLKYFRTFQARLLKFMRNDLIAKERSPTRSPMPELVQIDIPSLAVRFFKLEQEITAANATASNPTKPAKCHEVNLALTNVQVQVITKLFQYTVVKETIQCTYETLAFTASVPKLGLDSDGTFLSIPIGNFVKGAFVTARDYEVKTLKVLRTLDSFKQEKTSVHLHPILLQLFEAYNNVNQRPYLECDFDLYKTSLDKYVEECKRAYKLGGGGADARASEFLTIDNRILLETVLNTEDYSEKVVVPTLEMEYTSDIVEMYSFCGDHKIALNSEKPRYVSTQNGINAEYTGNYSVTFNNLRLEKTPRKSTVSWPVGSSANIESIFSMQSFSQDVSETNDLIKEKMKFMLLSISIREETFKDVLDIRNGFDLDYLNAIKQKRCVNPYQPPSFNTKPRKTVLDFREFIFRYQFNSGQSIALRCDYLGQNSEGMLNAKDQRIELKGIHLSIHMRDFNEYDVFEIKAITHTKKAVTAASVAAAAAAAQTNQMNATVSMNDASFCDFSEIPLQPSHSQSQQQQQQQSDQNPSYINKNDYSLEFDTLTFRIVHQIKNLSEYFSDFKNSTDRVKNFYSQLNLGLSGGASSGDAAGQHQPLQAPVNYINQMFRNPLRITWRNLSVVLEDTPMNCFLLGYQSFVRDYLGSNPAFNERHAILALQAAKRQHPLIGFYCDELVLSLEPLRCANTPESILNFINDIEEIPISASGNRTIPTQSTFSSFNCFHGSAGFNGASIRMRDYPENLLSMQKGFIHCSIIFAQLANCNSKDRSLRVFYNLVTEFANFDLTVGLCQASGVNDLLSRFKALFPPSPVNPASLPVAVAKTPKNNTSLDTSKQQSGSIPPQRKGSTKPSSCNEEQQSNEQKNQQQQQQTENLNLPYWDNVRLCYHGKIVMSKDSIMNFNLLTHIYPYSKDKLKFTIGKSFVLMREDTIKLYSQDILLKRSPRPDNETHVFKIPLVQAEVNFDWYRDLNDHYAAAESDDALRRFQSKKLNIFSKLNLPRVEPSVEMLSTKARETKATTNRIKRIVKNSEVPFIHYQVDFVNWLKNLPQLRRDQLFLYKIGVSKQKSEESRNRSQSTAGPSEQNDYSSDSESDSEIQLPQSSETASTGTRDSQPKRKRSSAIGSSNKEQKSRSNKSQGVGGSSEDGGEEQLEKNTDFISLLIYSVNQQLNSKSQRQNILQHIDDIKVSSLMSSTRLILSNSSQRLVSDPDEDDDIFASLDPIIGMQYVFDSIQLSFNVNHKQPLVNPTATKSNETNQNQAFRVNNGYGKLDFMYGSVFKSKGNLLNLDPPQFRRNKDKQKSMYDPKMFASYFSLKDARLAADMMLFNIQEELNGPFAFLARSIEINQANLKKPKTDFSRGNVTSEADDNITDFEFSVSGIFFSSDSLTYQQDTSLANDVYIQDDYGVMRKEITANQKIKNLLTVRRSRVLVTTQLNRIVNNVFFSMLDPESEQKLSSEQSTTQQQSTSSSPQQSIDFRMREMERMKKKMQISEKELKTSRSVQTRLKFFMQIEDPQFNLFYRQQKNQMVLTSREKCFILYQTHQLPFDRMKVDLKNNFKLFFGTLDCFAVRKTFGSNPNHAKWVSNYDDPLHKMYHIIRATHSVISFTSFHLPQCILDFNQPYVGKERNRPRSTTSTWQNPAAATGNDQSTIDHTFLWNGETRSKGLKLRVANFFSEVESKDYYCFYKSLELISLLLQSESKQRIVTQSLRQKKTELHNNGWQNVFNHIQKNLYKISKDTKIQESHLSYTIQTCSIKILDPQRKPFLDFRMPSLMSSTITYNNNQGCFQLIFGQITLRNLLEDGDFIDMIQYSGTDLQIRIENDFVDLKGIDPNTEWRAYNRYECFVPPLTVKLTETIYDPFYDFLFKADNSNAVKSSGDLSTSNSAAGSNNKSPQQGVAGSNQSSARSSLASDDFAPYYYFGKVNIKDLKMCLHYKSQSSLKRLNGVSVIVHPYNKEGMFVTNKEFFDDFSGYLKKQVASQIFSLLSQKFFGYSKNLDEETNSKKKKN